MLLRWQASQEGIANEPLYARVNKEKRRPEFPPESNIHYDSSSHGAYDGHVPPSPPRDGGGGGNQGADSWV